MVFCLFVCFLELESFKLLFPDVTCMVDYIKSKLYYIYRFGFVLIYSVIFLFRSAVRRAMEGYWYHSLFHQKQATRDLFCCHCCFKEIR